MKKIQKKENQKSNSEKWQADRQRATDLTQQKLPPGASKGRSQDNENRWGWGGTSADRVLAALQRTGVQFPV